MKKVIISLVLIVGLFANILGNVAYGFSIESNDGFKQIQHIAVPATYVASPLDVKVILPESYATSTDKKYPVVYLLNGYGGDEDSWLKYNEPPGQTGHRCLPRADRQHPSVLDPLLLRSGFLRTEGA